MLFAPRQKACTSQDSCSREVRNMRRVILMALLSAVGASTIACDETHSFTLINETESRVRIELALERPGAAQLLSLEPFSLGPGESDNDSGGIFYSGSVLHMRVTSDAEVILEKQFTYDELKEMEFRVKIR